MTPESLDLLLSADGQTLLQELSAEAVAGDELRLVTRYRARFAADLVSAALAMAKLRVRARSKFSRADAMYFTAAGLEQASTERMARHHARRYEGFAFVADLCSGIGGDLIGLADGRAVLAVDVDPVHLRMGRLNADVYGGGDRVQSMQCDVREAPLAGVEAAFIDPARRADGQRFRTGQSEPPLDWCFALAGRGTPLGIKAAPGLPVDVVPDGWELEFVSEGRELKESVLWSPGLTSGARRRATVLPGEHTLTEQPDAKLVVAPPGDYLLDPDPSITRAGLVEELGALLGSDSDVWKIDDQVAFLSANRSLETPFGRGLRIEASFPWSLTRLKEALRSLDVGTVDIRKRGSAVDVDDIHRRLKLTGSRPATVVLTRVSNKPWAMVCTD